MVKVYIDTREKKYVHDAFKEYISNADYESETLEIGDIVVGNFIIERKTINDLYNSLIKGNLFSQLKALNEFREENPDTVVILLVEYRKLTKDNLRYYKIWNLEQLMLNTMEQFKIMVMKTQNIQSTVNFINEIALYTDSDKEIIKRVRGYKRRNTLHDEKVFALMGFPTVGEKTAEKILESYDTLMAYFQSQEGRETKIAQILYKPNR